MWLVREVGTKLHVGALRTKEALHVEGAKLRWRVPGKIKESGPLVQSIQKG